MYLLVDETTDFKKVFKTFNELKEELIDIVKDDMLSNYGEYEIVKSCAEDLINLAKNNTSFDYVNSLFSSYSYKIVDLLQLQRDLEDTKEYFKTNYYASAFDEVIAKINDEVNK